MKKRYNSSEEIKKVYLFFERKNLIPKYTELFAYASSINLLFLFIIDQNFHEYLLSLLKGDNRGMLLGGILSIGIILSLVNPFVSRRKKNREKRVTQNSIILGNLIIIAYVVMTSPDGSFWFWFVYSLINFFYYLILLNYAETKNKSLVADENASIREIVIISVGLMTAIAILKYWAALPWQLTYNISTTMVFLATGILQKINDKNNNQK